ncbi:MAG: hypothetical protein ABJE47_17675 [bacterium]
MYAGHAAIALALKSRDPRVPLVPLALACYGPDWVELALMIPHPREGMAPYSHSIPAVLLGALLAGGLFGIVAGRRGAGLVAAGWLLHWPADLLTGHKPLLGLVPLIGLDLYRVPLADLALEALAVIIGCALYARAVATTSAHRHIVIAMGTVLVFLQLGLDIVISASDPQPWEPSLANVWWQPHLKGAGVLRTSLAHETRVSTASASWGQTIRLE